jgi:hypothetical protein
VPWVEEFGVDILGSDELSTDHKDLGRDVSTGTLVGFGDSGMLTYLDEGGFVASTDLKSCPKTHMSEL